MLFQAVDKENKFASLMQIPHFDEDVCKAVMKGKNGISTLEEFLKAEPENRERMIIIDRVLDSR
jgi:hypothetical protein